MTVAPRNFSPRSSRKSKRKTNFTGRKTEPIEEFGFRFLLKYKILNTTSFSVLILDEDFDKFAFDIHFFNLWKRQILLRRGAVSFKSSCENNYFSETF